MAICLLVGSPFCVFGVLVVLGVVEVFELRGVARCCAVLRGVAWCCVALRGVAWRCEVLRGVAWCRVVLRCVAWCCVALRGVAWCCVGVEPDRDPVLLKAKWSSRTPPSGSMLLTIAHFCGHGLNRSGIFHGMEGAWAFDGAWVASAVGPEASKLRHALAFDLGKMAILGYFFCLSKSYLSQQKVAAQVTLATAGKAMCVCAKKLYEAGAFSGQAGRVPIWWTGLSRVTNTRVNQS